MEWQRAAMGLAVPLAGGLASVGYVVVGGPYGVSQPKPAVCAAGDTCVIVAGLDGDIFYLPNGGDSIDLQDDGARTVAKWVAAADGAITPAKYPAEIPMPEVGLANFTAVEAKAVKEAKRIGQRYGASLVVVGEVEQGGYRLGFVDPKGGDQPLALRHYQGESAEPPEAFVLALKAALAGEPLPAQQPLLADAGLSVGPEDPAAEAVPAPAAASAPPASPPPPPAPVIVAASITPPPARAVRNATPRRAREGQIKGYAVVECAVRLDGAVQGCLTLEESPAGAGFGEAAVRVLKRAQGAPQTVNGAAIDAARTTIRIEFPPVSG